MNPIVEVKNLCKSYKEVDAVRNLSFSVYSGDVYGFLGQNGAGKSTTIRMLMTLIAPTSGTIQIFGKSLHNHRNETLKKIGAVIEKPDVYKYLTAYDNLRLFAKISGIKVTRQLLMDQLNMVGLAERWNSKVSTFSQGMKQRLGIAIALVHNPDLIILDEPTNGLDPQGIADIRNLILDLSKVHGKTIIVSSHLLSEIELIANRMIIIHKGEKIVEGDVQELLDPSKNIVQIETTNNEATMNILLASTFADAVIQNQLHLQLQINKIRIPALISYLSDKNVEIISIQSKHSLEDYFLNLTKAN
jgi:ABC-type branched-subunit amino acid transport system ATPase component